MEVIIDLLHWSVEVIKLFYLFVLSVDRTLEARNLVFHSNFEPASPLQQADPRRRQATLQYERQRFVLCRVFLKSALKVWLSLPEL